MRPPGRHTRSSSAPARDWSGANMTPKVDSTMSNAPSANGSRCASASCVSRVRPAAWARRAAACSNCGTKSVAITAAPRRAAARAALPEPATTSSTRSPGWMSTARHSSSATTTCSAPARAKSPSAHIARACCVISAYGSSCAATVMMHPRDRAIRIGGLFPAARRGFRRDQAGLRCLPQRRFCCGCPAWSAVRAWRRAGGEPARGFQGEPAYRASEQLPAFGAHGLALGGV